MVYSVIHAGYEQMTPQAAAASIVTRALDMLKNTNKLILAIGENHGQAIQQIVQAQILIGLKKNGKNPILAVELPDNTLSLLLQNRLDMTAKNASEIAADLRERRKEPKVATLGILGHGEETEGLRLLLHTAIKHDIPIHLVDAARQFRAAANMSIDKSRSAFLDLRDSEALKTAKKLNFPPAIIAQNNLNILETRGMHLRNSIMAARCKNLLTSNDTEIVVLNTGQTHLFGDKNGAHPRSYSLSGAFNKQPSLMVSLSPREPSDGRGEANAMHIHAGFGEHQTADFRDLVIKSDLKWADCNPDADTALNQSKFRDEIVRARLMLAL